MTDEVITPLPIGVENFEDMIKNGYYYVDKTLLIKEYLDKRGKVDVFTRPRRFGKTLNISMFQHFFDIQYADKKHLFDGLNISQIGEEYLSHQNKYPVIKLGFKDVHGSNFKEALEMLKPAVAWEYDRHSYLLESPKLPEHEKELFKKFWMRAANEEEYTGCLTFLSICLKKHYEENVIILIDEYDVPLEKAFFGGYYDDMVNFIRIFYSNALKTNDALGFSIITGCLRVSKESIFTGLNNLNVISISSTRYDEYFGFTEIEVKTILEHYSLEHKEEEMRNWYNGYQFGNATVYNPWSSIKYVADMTDGMPFANPHWSNTSSNEIIKDLIKISDDEVKKEIEILIAGGTITKPVKEDVIYAEIKTNMDNLWSFLYFTGYLKKVSRTQIGVHNHIELKIPNNELQFVYETKIIEWFDERIRATDLSKLYAAVLTQDVATMEDEINEMLSETISYMDSHENFYHGFLTGILRGIKGYITKSNRETGNGRGDILLRPVSIRKPAVVFEVKVANAAKDLVSKSDDALAQISKKKYDDELLHEGYADVIKYGIAFYRKDCLIKISQS